LATACQTKWRWPFRRGRGLGLVGIVSHPFVEIGIGLASCPTDRLIDRSNGGFAQSIAAPKSSACSRVACEEEVRWERHCLYIVGDSCCSALFSTTPPIEFCVTEPVQSVDTMNPCRQINSNTRRVDSEMKSRYSTVRACAIILSGLTAVDPTPVCMGRGRSGRSAGSTLYTTAVNGTLCKVWVWISFHGWTGPSGNECGPDNHLGHYG
jgi:hypothetical protein